MTKATKKSGGWNTVRQKLTAWNNPALLDLLKNPPQSPFTKGGKKKPCKNSFVSSINNQSDNNQSEVPS